MRSGLQKPYNVQPTKHTNFRNYSNITKLEHERRERGFQLFIRLFFILGLSKLHHNKMFYFEITYNNLFIFKVVTYYSILLYYSGANKERLKIRDLQQEALQAKKAQINTNTLSTRFAQ